MNFPTNFQLLRYHHIGILIGPLIFSVGIINLIWFIRLWRRRAGGEINYRPALFALIALTIGSAHFFSVYGSLWNAWRFRVAPEKIVEMSVERMATEMQQPVSEPVVINDRELIRNGFARLDSARGHARNHEEFADGYRIRLKLEGEAAYSERYLSVYRASGRNQTSAIVIPHLGAQHLGITHQAGEYECPEFLDWVNQTIAPRFHEH